MSITIKGASSGGVDIVAPASGSDVTLTLPSTTAIVETTTSSITSSRLTGALPAISGASLTSLTSGNLTGALPAISGASLTNLPAGGVDGIVSSANATAITIDSGEHVFMGATSYSGGGDTPVLYVSNSTSTRQMKIHNPAAGTSSLQITNATTGQGDDNGLHIHVLSTGKASITNVENNVLAFGTNATERMVIHSNGRVAIGSTNNEVQFHVMNATDNEGTCVLNANVSNFSKAVLNVMCARDIANQTFEIIQGRNGGGVRMRCWDSGDFDNTNNSYGGLSDERIKQDISDASSQWDDIKALRVRKFKLKRAVNKDGVENTPLHLGVIAQELEASNMSGLVSNSRPEKEDALLHADFGTWDGLDGEFTPGDKVKSVKYSILYMKSIKALQEAMARIESLESRIETLENA